MLCNGKVRILQVMKLSIENSARRMYSTGYAGIQGQGRLRMVHLLLVEVKRGAYIVG